jgi:hypothetical protein
MVAAEGVPNDEYSRYAEEWKASREATDKFDGILIDLRKYGFSFLTGLTTAGSFLGFSSPTQHIQSGVIIVTMALVVVLYWLDIYYQNLLYGSVLRSRFLEIFKLNKALGIYISALYGAAKIGRILHFLYVGFLMGLLILGLFVIGLIDKMGGAAMTAGIMHDFIILLGAFIFALAGIIGLYLLCDRRRTKAVRVVSDLFKEYRKCYIRVTDEGLKDLIVNTLENRIMNIFEKYL